MGQRHQVYVKIPAKFYQAGNPNNRPSSVIGIHHQWLYGQMALHSLNNLLTFVSKQGQYGPFKSLFDEEANRALEAIYSVDVSLGYYHGVHRLDAECEDPRRGDNNDGITVVDLSGDEPKYCFMSIHHLEGEDCDGIAPFQPLSAAEYVAAYYPKGGERAERMGDEFHAHSRALLESLSRYRVLTRKECAEIFPAMYEVEAEIDGVEA